MAQMFLGTVLLVLGLPVILASAAYVCAASRQVPFYYRTWWTSSGKPGRFPAIKLRTMRPMPRERPASQARESLLPGGKLLRVTGLDEL
ncbi:MAG: sugar transferase, partial [Chloroflexi bacterium]|nr:sugar transferase [Chloroflexota bacterium]